MKSSNEYYLIERLKEIMGYELPEAFISILFMNKEQRDNLGEDLNGIKFLSIEEILLNWTIWKELLNSGYFEGCLVDNDKEIQPDWWNIGWLPFTDNGAGDHICIDFNPTNLGVIGQIIEVWHDNNSRRVIASSFQSWLNSF